MNVRVMLALMLTLVPAGLVACGGGAGSSGDEDGAGGGDTETSAVGAGGENPGGGEGPTCVPAAIPELDTWEERMIGWEAQMHCDALSEAPGAGDPGLNAFLANVDYDAVRVYHQIADYTKDEKWRACADRAEQVYRDAFVLPEEGDVVAYWNHSDGLTLDALENGDQKSADAVKLLAANGDYCSDDAEGSTVDPLYSRENANCLMALINAERLGEPRRPEKLAELYENAYGHIDQWFVSRDYGYYEPFMFALTAESLISYYEHIDGDQEVVDAARDCTVRMSDSADDRVLPAFSSGQWAGTVPATWKAIGSEDLLFMSGGGILAHPDGPAAGVASIRQAWQAQRVGVSLEEYSRGMPELRAALQRFGKPAA